MTRPTSSPSDERVRLQKVLAAAGLGSRRSCETLIVEGRVDVNGQVVTELGTRIDPTSDVIRVDGETVKTGRRRRYFAVNKPVGVVCTHNDPDGRKRVVDLVPARDGVFPIGRLDRASSGLILLTDDGAFANLIAHPRYGVPKTYRVRVAGRPSNDQLEKLRKGVFLAEAKVRADSVYVKKRLGRSTELEITLREGRNREIRRMLAALGHKVQQLRRVAIGPLRLDKSLAPGTYRPLTSDEVRRLRKAATARSPKSGGRQRRRPPRHTENSSRRARTNSAPTGRGKREMPRRSGPVLNLVPNEDES